MHTVHGQNKKIVAMHGQLLIHLNLIFKAVLIIAYLFREALEFFCLKIYEQRILHKIP